MKVSYSWLKDYIKVDHKAEDLGDILTDIGLEVEGIDKVESIKGGLKGVIVAEVVECEQHPNADRLKVTQVNTGDEVLPVVCGAPNVKKGLKVLLATVGTTLYDEKGESWKIKKGKIRGEESHGMLCAEDELGLGKGHDGIMELPDSAEVGTSAAQFLELSTDEVFDIGLTPNRSDATGHLGVARDLKAYFNYHQQEKDWDSPKVEPINQQGTSLPIEVEVVNKEACPRYSGLVLDNIQVGPSPKWMQDRLNAIGVRPLNNVIDITNFVLHEYGQPLHAFDYDRVAGQKILVQNLPEGTPFLSLDEKERKLDKEDLMICDGEGKPMCIAGVFGGLGSGVTESTSRIFLESAHFEAISTRRSSTRHLLFTDAAKCFEKGSDPNVTVEAIERAVYLLKEYAGANVAGELIDIYPEPILPHTIEVSTSYLNNILGYTFTSDEVVSILKAMEMEVNVDGDTLVVQVPTNKADVRRPADIAEEVLRIFGMNNIPTADRLNYSFSHVDYGASHIERNKVGNLLAASGWHEAMGLSLTNQKLWGERSNLVKINNTSNVHLNVMRPDVLASMLESVAHNLNRQQELIRLFEFGKSYVIQDEDYHEEEVLGLICTGPTHPESWKNGNPPSSDFFTIKAAVDQILSNYYISSEGLEEVSDQILSPAYAVRKGKMELFKIGEINGDWKEKFGIKQRVFAAQINWDVILKLKKSHKPVESISKFPQTRRDLALVLDQEVTFQQVLQVVRKKAGKMLKSVELFDIYTNEEQLGANKKSYAIALTFSSPEKTLTDKEVDPIIDQLVKMLNDKLGASIRH